jgi:hypothetical protein
VSVFNASEIYDISEEIKDKAVMACLKVIPITLLNVKIKATKKI